MQTPSSNPESNLASEAAQHEPEKREASPCCSKTEQATCCEPSAKSACCGTPDPAVAPATKCGCR